MSQRPSPDQTTRWISHTAVSIAAGALVGKRSGTGGFIIGFVVAALLHEALDAPVAVLFTEAGI
jgi:RsiW-degrading membrane proteinase PrsW (M82 family)